MDLPSHHFNLSQLQKLISEGPWIISEEDISSGATQENIASGCICGEGFFGLHSVKVLHVLDPYHNRQHAPGMHFFHDKCLRECRTVNPLLYNKCPACGSFAGCEIAFSPVAHAVKAGEAEEALKLIADGADPDAPHSWKAQAAVHIATNNGNLELLLSLLSGGADINKQDKSGMTALHHAVENSHLQAMQLLLDHKADMNIRDETGRTALHLAAGKPEIPVLFDLLIDNGASFDLANNNGRKVIHFAAESGHERALKKLIVKHDDVNALDQDHGTPLFYATRPFFYPLEPLKKNAPEVARILLAAGARIELCTRVGLTVFDAIFDHDNPLHIELLKELLPKALNAFTDVNQLVSQPRRATLLYFALLAKDLEAVENLIARGADTSTIGQFRLKILLSLVGEQRQAFVDVLNQAGSTSTQKRKRLGSIESGGPSSKKCKIEEAVRE
ncbi:ankyrin repeat domain-containing protein [Thalassotalea sp. G20_0]|uniref:ankyrin repeat domain-containing protein n=1 Tax=Thalassotalea sp. G20_0 TaxID=2821093 RepID=UPI001ADD41E4|nr:ankyrin repeat domain-containing protein [Thalassotalea sp. G20_0]MBO9496760.1 ankyrin repeat domain-containing protein [Thalassotalea sp. G20_0]